MNIGPYTLYGYSERSFIVLGEKDDMVEIKEELKRLGGKFNPNLKVGGENVPGWVFSIARQDDVIAFLQSHIADTDEDLQACLSQIREYMGMVLNDVITIRKVSSTIYVGPSKKVDELIQSSKLDPFFVCEYSGKKLIIV